tara:strand:- start:529 stop:654 length:126 start_codon:yes stop_codon:yes gene_type:complete
MLSLLIGGSYEPMFERQMPARWEHSRRLWLTAELAESKTLL